MEDNRRQPDQPPQPDTTEYPEVILEPIQDLGLKSKPRRNGSSAIRRKKRRRQQRAIIVLGAVFVVILSVFLVLFISSQRKAAQEAAAQAAADEAARVLREQQQQEYEQMANATTFLTGITVNGIDISGMTMGEAKAALSSTEVNADARREIMLVYNNVPYPLDLTNLNSVLNTDEVLTEAYRLGKTGDYETMKSETEEIRANGLTFKLTTSYDVSELAAAVAPIAAKIDVPAQDAKVIGIDESTHALNIKDEVVGLAVDQIALLSLITDSLKNGMKTAINIPVTAAQPSLTKADLTGLYVKRGDKETDFSSSDSERKYNVRKGAEMINGTVLKPGEEFSANDTLGERTKQNGWKVAHAYVQGAIEEQYGGGVCQLSTTLYNAVVKADLEIVFRRNHSMPVGYVEKGLDATINSVGNIIDFKFKNNTKGDIVIIGYTTKSNKLVFEVWGLPLETTEYDEIKLTSVQVSKTEITGEPVTIEKPVGTEKPDGSLIHARTGVADLQDRIAARQRVAVVPGGLLAQFRVPHRNTQAAACGHGVARIHRQVHQHLLQLSRVGPHDRVRGQVEGHRHIFADQAPQQGFGFRRRRAEPQEARLQRLLAAEGQQLLGEPGRPVPPLCRSSRSHAAWYRRSGAGSVSGLRSR